MCTSGGPWKAVVHSEYVSFGSIFCEHVFPLFSFPRSTEKRMEKTKDFWTKGGTHAYASFFITNITANPMCTRSENDA